MFSSNMKEVHFMIKKKKKNKRKEKKTLATMYDIYMSKRISSDF